MTENTDDPVAKTGDKEAMVRIYDDGTISVADAAKILGVSYNTIKHWIKNGMPVKVPGGRGKGTPARLLMKALLEWKVDEAAGEDFEGEDGEVYNLEKSKARLAHMKADIEEMKRNRAAGQVVMIEDVASVIETDYTNIRSGVMNLPARLAVKVSTMSESREIYDYIKTECVELLQTLTTPEEVGQRALDRRFVGDEIDEDEEDDEEDMS